MIELPNADKADPKDKLPTIEVTWDPETQGVNLRFKTEEFKNWDFVAACLLTAVNLAKFNAEVMRMQHVQQKAMEEQQNRALASQIRMGKR